MKKNIKYRYYVDKIILIGKKNIIFYVYLYRGHINTFMCYINNINGGYFYEFIYDSLKSEQLPNEQLIKMNNNEIRINIYDDFNLKEDLIL